LIAWGHQTTRTKTNYQTTLTRGLQGGSGYAGTGKGIYVAPVPAYSCSALPAGSAGSDASEARRLSRSRSPRTRASEEDAVPGTPTGAIPELPTVLPPGTPT
jgi:hypothetical protein